ncbi:unnamed protein product [Paramecium sonneborni]|uniref:Protein kinase domain-containing protein n=1 Tax=Paramecium sonneborni TaxID=65129 RepID=A0A8S1P087_9CILI|nr:unnamed protein product [Paramecium sonneborni]
MGGATQANEYHSTVINTRQYRAPEVILRCDAWDTSSDIWSLACLIVELYTGKYSKQKTIQELYLFKQATMIYYICLSSNLSLDLFQDG